MKNGVKICRILVGNGSRDALKTLSYHVVCSLGHRFVLLLSFFWFSASRLDAYFDFFCFIIPFSFSSGGLSAPWVAFFTTSCDACDHTNCPLVVVIIIRKTISGAVSNWSNEWLHFSHGGCVCVFKPAKRSIIWQCQLAAWMRLYHDAHTELFTFKITNWRDDFSYSIRSLASYHQRDAEYQVLCTAIAAWN